MFGVGSAMPGFPDSNAVGLSLNGQPANAGQLAAWGAANKINLPPQLLSPNGVPGSAPPGMGAATPMAAAGAPAAASPDLLKAMMAGQGPGKVSFTGGPGGAVQVAAPGYQGGSTNPVAAQQMINQMVM